MPNQPALQVRDAGNLLTRAGFALPTVDTDTFEMRYAGPADLVAHLRGMGESAAFAGGRRRLRRSTALAAAAAYQRLFGGEDGSIPATFQASRRDRLHALAALFFSCPNVIVCHLSGTKYQKASD